MHFLPRFTTNSPCESAGPMIPVCDPSPYQINGYAPSSPCLGPWHNTCVLCGHSSSLPLPGGGARSSHAQLEGIILKRLLIPFLAVCLFSLAGEPLKAAEAPEAPPAAKPAELPKPDSGDTAWMLVSTGLVLLMVPGLALFYGGMVRRKNV